MGEQKPLTPDEVLNHPEYNHLIWDLKPSQVGKAAVAKSRGGPINIAYELHGHGNRHIVVCPIHMQLCVQFWGLQVHVSPKLGHTAHSLFVMSDTFLPLLSVSFRRMSSQLSNLVTPRSTVLCVHF